MNVTSEQLVAQLTRSQTTTPAYGLVIRCAHCGLMLMTPGALLFSPPNQDGLVEKHHFCVGCFHKIAGLLAA